MRAVVVAHGDVDLADAVHARDADLVIAADGGSEHLARWGIVPHAVVGDLDSARESPAAAVVERWPREKDKSDTELAVERALASGADEIVVLGALGGARLDHEIANLLLLASAVAMADRVRIVRGALSLRALRGGATASLTAGVGDLVSLHAVGGDAEGVTTSGLRYALRDGTLKLGSSRGISNEVASNGATVSVRSGTLLIVESGRLAAGAQPQAKA